MLKSSIVNAPKISTQRANCQKFAAVLTAPGVWYWSNVEWNGVLVLDKRECSLISFGS